MIVAGDALDLISSFTDEPDLIVTDPPYAFGGSGDEHAISATVAVVLRESARKLRKGRWMLVMCASSWRSTSYMVEAVRGIVEPVRLGTWCKPAARTKVATTGWQWASVKVIAFKKGKATDKEQGNGLDHITAAPIINGRRAELPPAVADWMVAPYKVPGGLLLDPFAGSGAILAAAERAGMRAVGFERNAAPEPAPRQEAAGMATPYDEGYWERQAQGLALPHPDLELYKEVGKGLRDAFELGRSYQDGHEECIDCGCDLPRWAQPTTPPKGWPRCEPCRVQY